MPNNSLKDRRPSAAGLALILLSFVAYVSLGLPDGLLGVAWPSIRLDFSLPLDSLGALLITATIGYLTASFFGGRMLSRFKIGQVLAASSLAAGAALVAYALSPCWWAMVSAGLVAGLGAGAIDVALNTYVASYHGSGLMQLLHASYGIGATIGPVIMTVAINVLSSWRWGYALVGGLQLILAVSFFLTVSLWEVQKSNSQKEKATVNLSAYNTSMLETLCRRSVWISIFLFFVYMGVEYTLGTWTYTLLTESRGVPTGIAGFWMGGYWGIFTAGRLMVGLFAAKVRERVIVLGGLMIALFALILLVWNVNNGLNIIAVTIAGLSIAPIMPALLSGTTSRVGVRYSANTIGIQVSSMGVGAAAISSISGVIAQRFSLEAIPIFLALLTAVLIPAYYLSLCESDKMVSQ